MGAGFVLPALVRNSSRLAGVSTLEEVGAQHANYTLELLRERSSVLDSAIRRGVLHAVAAQYSLISGRVREVVPLPEHQLLVA